MVLHNRYRRQYIRVAGMGTVNPRKMPLNQHEQRDVKPLRVFAAPVMCVMNSIECPQPIADSQLVCYAARFMTTIGWPHPPAPEIPPQNPSFS